MSNTAYINRYLGEMQTIIERLSREEIDRAIEVLFDAWRSDRGVFLMGNGGSASTATHFACDLSKVTIVEGQKRLRAISLTDNIPLMTAWINDNGFDNLFGAQLL